MVFDDVLLALVFILTQHREHLPSMLLRPILEFEGMSRLFAMDITDMNYRTEKDYSVMTRRLSSRQSLSNLHQSQSKLRRTHTLDFLE